MFQASISENGLIKYMRDDLSSMEEALSWQDEIIKFYKKSNPNFIKDQIKELESDPEWKEMQIKKLRTSEYPSQVEMVEALIKKEMGDNSLINKIKIRIQEIDEKYSKKPKDR